MLPLDSWGWVFNKGPLIQCLSSFIWSNLMSADGVHKFLLHQKQFLRKELHRYLSQNFPWFCFLLLTHSLFIAFLSFVWSITCRHFQMSISSLKAVSLVKNYNSIILMVGGDVHSKYITLIHSFLSNLILKSLHIIYKFQDVISLYHGLHNK